MQDTPTISTTTSPTRARLGIRDKRAIGLLALSHLVDDIYLGAIPAILPFLVLERECSYAAAGVTFAATFVSPIAQPLFGILAARRSLPPLALLISFRLQERGTVSATA